MRNIWPALLVALAALAVTPGVRAQSDNFPYSIMRPEPGSPEARKPKAPKEKPAPETNKKAEPDTAKVQPKPRRHIGSSSPVYPTSLPPPLHYNPPPVETVTPAPHVVPPAMAVPQTGMVLPNLPAVGGAGPGGSETSQDRAVRCAHQAGLYGPAQTGDRNAYVGGCINQ